MKAAVFIDRDNTIIHNDGDLGDPAKVNLIQGAASAIASLRGLGYLIVVVTNQGGVARGKYGVGDVEKVHERLNELIDENAGARVDRFYYCPYHPKGSVERYRREHPWRKPQPGMILQAAKDLDLDLSQSWMIGDQLRDVEAGHAGGVRTVLLKADAELMPPLKVGQLSGEGDSQQVQPDFTVSNLIEATRIIAQQRRPDQVDEQWSKPKAIERVNQHVVATRTSLAERESSPPAHDKAKPFRPWNAPLPEEGDGSSDVSEGESSSPGSAPGSAPAPAPAPAPGSDLGSGSAPGPPGPSGPSPKTEAVAPSPKTQKPSPPISSEVVKKSTAEKSVASTAALPRQEEASSAVGATPSTPVAAEEPQGDAVETARLENSGSARVLRQILTELRSSRHQHGEFSYLRMFATVLQMVAGVCLLTSLWLGYDELATFMHWMGTTLVIQLSVIAMLLFDRL